MRTASFRAVVAAVAVVATAGVVTGCHLDPTTGTFVCDLSDYQFYPDGPGLEYGTYYKVNPFCAGDQFIHL